MSRSLAEDLAEHRRVVDEVERLLPVIEDLAGSIVERLRAGGRVLLMGNGGSAADSQHIAAELVGRFMRRRRALPAVALTTDTSALTAISNDFGFEHVFERQLEALCGPADVVIGISTSGMSSNVVRAMELACGIGALTVALSGGEGGRLAELAEIALVLPFRAAARVQEGHILIGHLVCERIDEAFDE